jgi:hypothetical protein
MEGIGGGGHPVPRTVDEVFSDYKGRRAGLIKALTTGHCFAYSLLLLLLLLLFSLLFRFFSLLLLILLLLLLLADVQKFYQLCDPG